MPSENLILRVHLERAGLDPKHLPRVIDMCRASPARKTGKGALDNITVRFQSQKNACSRLLESHTVERLYAYELELDPTVVCYYSQVQCHGIERKQKSGRRHVSNATVDFLVVRNTGIELIECKTRQAAATLVQNNPEEWHSTEDFQISRPPLERWAETLGLRYRVWLQPPEFSIRLANLALLYGVSALKEPGAPHRLALARLSRSACSISELTDAVKDFTPLTALQLLRSRLCFGPTFSVALDDIDNFLLFADEEQADTAARAGLDQIRGRLKQADDPISSATMVDLSHGRERLAKLLRMEAGQEGFTRAYRELKKAVDAARAAGTSELVPCLTNYANSGNRTLRLPPAQEEALRVVCRLWNSGTFHDIEDARERLRIECRQRGEEVTPTRTTLCRRLAAESPTKHALSTGGMRKYQNTRESTDPRKRSLDALAVGGHLQIDSTPIDNRVFPGIENILLLERPLIYIAVDRCADGPVAHSLGFGPARTSALAMLIRDYVRRYGRLPQVIQVDRGPEMTAKWLEGFCDYYGIILLINPTAASASNGQVENVNGRLNPVLHRLPGSTKPDRDGRGVDGRFKSYRTARLQFSFLRDEVEKILHEDIWSSPLADGRSPSERSLEALELFGHVGKAQMYDEDFLFQTSTRVSIRTLDERRGVRTGGYRFSSTELLAAARFSDLDEVRRDCADPSLVRVQLKCGRFKAWSSLAPRLAARSALDVEFHAYYGTQLRRDSVPRREQVRSNQYARAEAILQDLAHRNESGPAQPELRTEKQAALPSLPYEAIDDYPEQTA
ncbi:integrase catalytic domain-containing protein [Lysobacter soli]|uniref:integrase catalytic domain-containing protein n=1 Tax=Lysobacter soli TaxID=453783 RepID=UPI0018DE2E59|nr:DDE-type integrase/transposase/recombinase [Lysobacter soli]